MTDLQKTLQDYDSAIQKTGEVLSGEMGVNIRGEKRTTVANRGQFVYVRLRSNLSEVIQAFNDKVFPGYGVPVLLKWNNSRYEIIGRDTLRYQQWEEDKPLLIKHGETHSLDKDGNNLGSDPVWVYPYNFIPHLVSPFNLGGVQNAYIHPHTINYKGSWKYVGNTGTPSLTTYNPISGSALVLITIDGQSGNPTLFPSSGYISPNVTGSFDLVSYLPDIDMSRYLPVSFARIISGTNQITWNHLYDVRQFISRVPSLQINSFSDIDNIQFSGLSITNTGTVAYISSAGGGSTGSFGNWRFDIAGVIETGTSMSQPYLVTDPSSISMAYLYAEGLGVTGTTIIDVLKNNVSIFTGTPLSLPYNLPVRVTLPLPTQFFNTGFSR